MDVYFCMRSANSQHGQKIGIVADSHGQAACIGKALIYFRGQGCGTIYHLGDICDSAHPETADDCVALLRQNHIAGIKGNNDHLVVVNHQGHEHKYVSAGTIEFLKQLPMTVEHGDVIMTHSLPFVKERGLSSMVGTLGHAEAAMFFQKFPRKVLLRGHSHQPEIICRRKQSLKTNKLLPEKTLQLDDVSPSIITCGALDQGFVLIWDTAKQTISSHTIR